MLGIMVSDRDLNLYSQRPEHCLATEINFKRCIHFGNDFEAPEEYFTLFLHHLWGVGDIRFFLPFQMFVWISFRIQNKINIRGKFDKITRALY